MSIEVYPGGKRYLVCDERGCGRPAVISIDQETNLCQEHSHMTDEQLEESLKEERNTAQLGLSKLCFDWAKQDPHLSESLKAHAIDAAARGGIRLVKEDT